MNGWQIGILIFGVIVILCQTLRLGRLWPQSTALKRRQEVVYLIGYSLLIAMVVLPRRLAGWKFLADVLMLVFLFYWFRLRQSVVKEESAAAKQKTLANTFQQP